MINQDFIVGLLIGLFGAGGIGIIILGMSGQMPNLNFPGVIKRILDSKKFVLMMVPVIANAIVAYTGQDPTNDLMKAIDIGFITLSGFQFVLDAIHGSSSDGTVKKTQ